MLRQPVARRMPLRLESMEGRLAPAVFTVTNLNDSGSGSLRQAVLDANSNFGLDTILFPTVTGAITLTTGEIAITEAVDLFGPGSSKLTVSGNNQSRIFNIGDQNFTVFHVGINGMRLTQGAPGDDSVTEDGGAIITGNQELELRDVVLTSNTANRGGAIFAGNDARLTMLNCSATGNIAQDSGGAIYADGGSNALLTACVISGNSASNSGGAIYADGGSTLTIQNSTISGNSAGSNGGGIIQYPGGDMTVDSSTIAGNSAANNGGGIHAGYAEVFLVNSTISGNSARQGGGLFLYGGYYGGELNLVEGDNGKGYGDAPATINHCTIVSNAVNGDSASGVGGGIFSTRRVDMANTIVALNTANVDPDLHGNPVIPPAVVEGNGGPTFSSFFCLIQNPGPTGLVDDQGGSIFGFNPLLGPLQNNGGPTATHALTQNSPAFNAGDPDFTGPPFIDQRGFPRIAFGRLDIGAFELQPGPIPPEPPQPVPPINLNAVGSGPRGDSTVRVYNNAGQLLITFQPFDTSFRGEIHVATGDMDGDGVEDVITGAGPGGGPHVQVFSGARLLSGVAERIVSALGSYFSYNPGFRGGVNVASADVNGDGRSDIITGAGPGGGPHVIAWDVKTGQAITSFYAYDPSFAGGVTVGGGNTDGAANGAAEIITGAGPGGGPHVRIFSNTGTMLREFFAYDPAFTGGVFVAAGDVTGDGIADVVTGAGQGGGPHVKVFDGTSLALVRSFYAFESIFTGGVRVATANLDADANLEIIVGAGPLGGPHVRFVDNDLDNTQINSFYSIDKDFNGGVFVG